MTTKARVAIIRAQEADATHPAARETFDRLSKGTVGVVNIHRTLANSPEVFARFIGLAHALRFETDVEPAARELAILRVLERHHGHYEIAHHARMAAAAGLTDAQIAGTKAATLDPALYDEKQLAALRYATEFAANEGVDPAVAAELAKHFDNRQIIELTLTMSLYLGLAHLTNTLDVPLDNPAPAAGT